MMPGVSAVSRLLFFGVQVVSVDCGGMGLG